MQNMQRAQIKLTNTVYSDRSTSAIVRPNVVGVEKFTVDGRLFQMSVTRSEEIVTNSMQNGASGLE